VGLIGRKSVGLDDLIYKELYIDLQARRKLILYTAKHALKVNLPNRETRCTLLSSLQGRTCSASIDNTVKTAILEIYGRYLLELVSSKTVPRIESMDPLRVSKWS
jgi:hypothetical protein